MFGSLLPVRELAALGGSAALLVAYYVWIRRKARSDPNFTVQQINERIRLQWVEGVLSESKGILAVQTLRNSTMAATFLASTSVILVLGIVNMIAKGEVLVSPASIKLLLLLLDLFFAFFGFAMSIRLYNHAGYMLGAPTLLERDEHAVRRVARHLDRAARHYSAGMRAFYFLIPLVFWFFGPWAMLLATVGLVFVLFSNDRAPRVD